jgi:short subunit dehydrogenase-like uncharacterized protein
MPPATPASRSATRRRAYDIVLYGASGFVGRQAVAYLASCKHPQGRDLRWALAGRNPDKLEQARKAGGRGAAQAAIVVAAADDAKALDKLARQAKVVLSTAGPFALHGSALVQACVAHGTHYVDITGETPWVRAMIDRHHAQAMAGGARIVPFCGFDSVPSDLGAWMLVQAMQQRHGAACVDVKAAFAMRGGVNGGTLASALNLLDSGSAPALADPFLLDPAGAPRRDLRSHADPVLPYFDGDFQTWLAPFVMGPVNTRVVRRSAALLAYGAPFHYQEYQRVGSGLLGGAAALSLSAGMRVTQAALGVSALRRVAARLMPRPGAGPSDARMDQGWFRCDLVGRSATGKLVRARIEDQGDPGNRATTKMVCEAALTLLGDADALPGGAGHGGVLTPASGLGEALVRRLRDAGMTLQVEP